MKTCIFLCKKRHDYFNLCSIYDANKYRFICIIPHENLHAISDKNKSFFNEIIPVSTVCESIIEPIVQDEINRCGDSKNIRLLCLDEMDLLLAATMRKKFNIPGGKVPDYLPFRNKIIMKEILKNDNIRVPNFLSLQNIESNNEKILYEKIISHLNIPFIVKPISGASSLNTAKIENFSNFTAWYESVGKKTIDYEAEEFIDGKLYHCDSFVKSGEILFSEVSECISTCLDYANGHAADGSIVLPKDNELRNAIINFNANVIDALNPPDGALHHELFVNNIGEIIFLEIAARPGGGEIVNNLEKNFGINLYEQTLRNELDDNVCFDMKSNLYHCWFYALLPEGKIRSLHLPKLKSPYQIEWRVSVGDIISPSKISVLRQEAALITLHHPDFQIIYNDFNYLRMYQAVEVE